MTTKTATDATPVMTPAGARERDENGAENGEFEVPEKLRAEYDATPNVGPDNYIYEMRTVKGTPPSFELWQHRRRLQYAATQVGLRERAAELEARKRTCTCCGERYEASLSSSLGHGRGLPVPLPAVCPPCRPMVAEALRARAPLPDGRTRAEAADELAARLLADREA